METYNEDIPMPDAGAENLGGFAPLKQKTEINLKGRTKMDNQNELIDISMSPEEKKPLKKTMSKRKLRKPKNMLVFQGKENAEKPLRRKSNTSSQLIRKEHADASLSTDWVHVHRDIPIVVSGYLQLLFNVCIISIVLYFLFSLVFTIQGDIRNYITSERQLLAYTAMGCQRDYNKYECDSPSKAISDVCDDLRVCILRKTSNTRLVAKILAEIIDTFVTHISYKTMIFSLVLVFGSLIASNYAFGLFRAKHSQNLPTYATSAIPAMISSNRLLEQGPNDNGNQNLLNIQSEEGK
ncbi:nuclear envelope protein Brr6/Brl1 [Schizosaccharomyces cryophilus OY26]|uniref:Nuclear envelope protein Brr6/Brl1 n=1 Tax=Schizosaccharomyces cryophilus (strain OY26 / ATCC MYA-4695 / CBS 11777 / NBRC 106824 / NRRL Y48691) TaxID=653667 RepID=S9X7Z8_SCHCR|nr:nuclear envelope protein Brr6/Brl1 [Schizosaccharomyces cryophilus OY26]EPY53262.1 nuclear envelope protein Brr6/Brl1 [Schizosaccharomyces cryophilus OY26]